MFASKGNSDGLLLGVIFLVVDIALYAAILSFINMGYVRFWFNALKNHIYGTETTNKDEGDYDVKQEYDKVQQYKEDRTSECGVSASELNVISSDEKSKSKNIFLGAIFQW